MQFLTLDEFKALLKATDDITDRLMFKVTYWHGLRNSEATALTGAAIQDGFVDVKRLKGSNRTRQPFIDHPDGLLDEAKELMALAREKKARELLFPAPDGERMNRWHFLYRYKKAAKAAGLPKHKQHPHCLKHSIAVATIKEAGIENVRQWLGHKSIASTGEYLKVNDETAAKVITSIVTGVK